MISSSFVCIFHDSLREFFIIQVLNHLYRVIFKTFTSLSSALGFSGVVVVGPIVLCRVILTFMLFTLAFTHLLYQMLQVVLVLIGAVVLPIIVGGT